MSRHKRRIEDYIQKVEFLRDSIDQWDNHYSSVNMVYGMHDFFEDQVVDWYGFCCGRVDDIHLQDGFRYYCFGVDYAKELTYECIRRENEC